MNDTKHFFGPLLHGAMGAADGLAKSIPAFQQAHPELLSGFAVDILQREALAALHAFAAAAQLSDITLITQSLQSVVSPASCLLQYLNELSMRSPATLSCSVMIAQVKALLDISDMLCRTLQHINVYEADIEGETFHHLGVMPADKED